MGKYLSLRNGQKIVWNCGENGMALWEQFLPPGPSLLLCSVRFKSPFI